MFRLSLYLACAGLAAATPLYGAGQFIPRPVSAPVYGAPVGYPAPMPMGYPAPMPMGYPAPVPMARPMVAPMPAPEAPEPVDWRKERLEDLKIRASVIETEGWAPWYQGWPDAGVAGNAQLVGLGSLRFVEGRQLGVDILDEEIRAARLSGAPREEILALIHARDSKEALVTSGIGSVIDGSYPFDNTGLAGLGFLQSYRADSRGARLAHRLAREKVRRGEESVDTLVSTRGALNAAEAWEEAQEVVFLPGGLDIGRIGFITAAQHDVRNARRDFRAAREAYAAEPTEEKLWDMKVAKMYVEAENIDHRSAVGNFLGFSGGVADLIPISLIDYYDYNDKLAEIAKIERLRARGVLP